MLSPILPLVGSHTLSSMDQGSLMNMGGMTQVEPCLLVHPVILITCWALFHCLFPYGLGEFEVLQSCPVSYEAHAKWAMQYSDKHFHKDFHFMFQVFGVIWKCQVC